MTGLRKAAVWRFDRVHGCVLRGQNLNRQQQDQAKGLHRFLKHGARFASEAPKVKERWLYRWVLRPTANMMAMDKDPKSRKPETIGTNVPSYS